MKILFVDIACDGHHIIYLKNLVESKIYQSIICLPVQCNEINAKQYIVKTNPSRDLISYIRWIKEIASIADIEQIDIILIMHMDSLMRYFSLYLGNLKKFGIIVIYHHLWSGFLRKLSYLLISRKIDYAVVHTQPVEDKLMSYGIKNIKRLEYPGFGAADNNKAIHSPRRLLAFGATRYDKGLDILLEALNLVKENFILYIVGKDTYFDRKYISEHSAQYKDKIYLDLRVVSDKEKEEYFAQTDIVILPYRKIFDGASGPLGDGVIKEKVIIGPNHGSIRYLIEENHIGYTFSSESPESLAEVISKAIKMDFTYDEKAINYKKYLLPERMRHEYEALFLSLVNR